MRAEGRKRVRWPPAVMRMPPAAARVFGEPDSVALAATVGDLLSSHTQQMVQAAPPGLHAPLILGSPEFMMRLARSYRNCPCAAREGKWLVHAIESHPHLPRFVHMTQTPK
jgi:hypothetical protein